MVWQYDNLKLIGSEVILLLPLPFLFFFPSFFLLFPPGSSRDTYALRAIPSIFCWLLFFQRFGSCNQPRDITKVT